MMFLCKGVSHKYEFDQTTSSMINCFLMVIETISHELDLRSFFFSCEIGNSIQFHFFIVAVETRRYVV